MGAATTTTKRKSLKRFPYTLRMQVYEAAIQHGLHVVRDNFHLWALREPLREGGQFEHVWICCSSSYDGLWRAAIDTFRDPDFNAKKLPFVVSETDGFVTLYDPVTNKERKIDKSDLRSRRGD